MYHCGMLYGLLQAIISSYFMLELKQATLRRGTRCLFQHADVRLFPGWHVGLCGANGTGKSSLMAVLLGTHQLDHGDVRFPPGWRFASMNQEIPATDQSALDFVLDGDTEFRSLQRRIASAEEHPQSQAPEILAELAQAHADFAALDGFSTPARAATLMAGLGFGQNQLSLPIRSFSGGWRIRLGLARALMCRSDILLLDEPTNHLDLDALLWLEQWLKSYPGLLLLIAHDRDFLDGVCDHIITIEHETLTLYTGNYSSMELSRSEHRLQREQQRQRVAAERAHLESFINRFRAQATKARQAQSRIKRLERLEEIAPLQEESPFRFQFLAPERMPVPLVNLDHVTIGYASTTILHDVNMQLNPGDRIGILGHNGAGKSTLLKVVAGALLPESGKRTLAPDIRIAYYHQHQLEAFADEDTPLLSLQRRAAGKSEVELRTFLGRFGFGGDRVLEPCKRFSGGERARLALALCAWTQPHVLLLDEPTNHLDIEMRLSLALALQEFSGALVLISHDRSLLSSCCDTLWLVENQTCLAFDGDLTDYASRAKQGHTDESMNDRPKSSVLRKDQKRLEAEQRQQLRPLRQKLQHAERIMEQLQCKYQQVQDRLHDPNIYLAENKATLLLAMSESESLRQQLDVQEQLWLELSEAIEHASI